MTAPVAARHPSLERSQLELAGAPIRFYAESFAPWCERARWALDHHGLTYREVEQVPLVSELTLRIAARRPLRRVTVPLLVHGGTRLMDSDEIARYAERLGTEMPLFPIGHDRDIARWMETSEALMVAGRAMLLPRIANTTDALREQLPALIPGPLRPALAWVAALAVRHLMSKYDVRAEDDAHHDAASRVCLDRLRNALARRAGYLVGDTLSYADVTMAAALQFVRPVDDRWIALGPATREVWTNHRLAADYPDLLAWRDQLYARARGPARDT